MKIITVIQLLIISSLSTSCFLIKGSLSMPKSWNWGFKPRPYMARGLPDGKGPYTQGFRDGCKSVLAMVAQGMVKNVTPEYDGWKLTSNKLYASGFVDGEEHCTYIYDWDIT